MPILPRLTSPRAAIMAVFAAFGGAVGALAGSIPSVTREAGIDSLALGGAITLSSLGNVAIMSCGGLLARHFSNRAVLLWGLPAFGLFTVLLLTSRSPWAFFAFYIAMGLATGLVDIFMNAGGAAIERDLRSPIFSAFHACVSSGVLVLAIASSFLSTEIGTWATALPVATGFAVAWLMVKRIILPRSVAGGAGAHISSLANVTPLVVLGLAAGLIISSEMAALFWSAKLLDEQAPDLAAIAGLGAAFFGLCNAAVRFPGDRLRSAFGELPLMTGSLLVAILGFSVLGLSSRFAVSVAGFAAVGLGTAVLIPCVFALAAGLVPGNRAGGIGFVSLIAGVPRILAPWGFGWIASGYGLSMAFGLQASGLAAALALVLLLRRGARKHIEGERYGG